MPSTQATAFQGQHRIASGELALVALAAKHAAHGGGQSNSPILIFNDATGRVIDLDYRGSDADLLARLEAPASEPPASAAATAAPRGPGRPRLGVVAREITLLPRHWEWLAAQPGGASVAIRRLVEEARRANAGKDRVRAAQETAYRFMMTMAGNEPGYEEALRALYAGQSVKFDEWTAPWPPDIRDHARRLAAPVFA